VSPFPLAAVTTLLSHLGSRTSIIASSSDGDPSVAAGIASFVLAVASFWVGILVALVVFECLLADVRAPGGDEQWSPSIAWSLDGLGHLGAAAFSPLLFVSGPPPTHYVYRRRDGSYCLL
jgi:hypothetical protein